MISLLPPSEEHLATAVEAFESVAPIQAYSKGFLAKATKLGLYKAVEIQHEGEPYLIMWVSVSQDKGLWVHACQQLKPFSVDLVFVAAEMMKREYGYKYIRFMTFRGGLVRTAKKHGYIVEGVVLSKR